MVITKMCKMNGKLRCSWGISALRYQSGVVRW